MAPTKPVQAENKLDMEAVAALLVACAAGLAIRTVSLSRHGFHLRDNNPYFNYRITEHLVTHGSGDFHDWYDHNSWYPFGRDVASTTNSGLPMLTAGLFQALTFCSLNVDLKTLCIYMPLLFTVISILAVYKLVKDIKGGWAGITSAYLVALCPGLAGRTLAGAYDGECMGIALMLWTFYFWNQSLKTGSIQDGLISAVSYIILGLSWGGHVYVINLLALHTFTLALLGRFGRNIYMSYSVTFALGAFVFSSNFAPNMGFERLCRLEFLFPAVIFAFCQVLAASHVSRQPSDKASIRDGLGTIQVLLSLFFVLGGLFLFFKYDLLTPFSPRSLFLSRPFGFDEVIRQTNPLLVSPGNVVPATWASFYLDLEMLMALLPVGVYFLMKEDPSDAEILVILYAASSLYGTGAVVRFMVVLAPAASILGGIAITSIAESYGANLFSSQGHSKKGKDIKSVAAWKQESYEYSLAVIGSLGLLTLLFTLHSVWVNSEHYSTSPLAVILRKGKSKMQLRDFETSFEWIKNNTPEDAKILAWWDHGYRISTLANRTTICDGALINTTHVAKVAQALVGTEAVAYSALRDLQADYVFVVFGGFVGFAADDLGKIPWMIRAAKTLPSSTIDEADYYTSKNQLRFDSRGSPALLNSLLYKLSFHRFGNVLTSKTQGIGFDKVRKVEIGNKHFDLDSVEEVFTSENWLVRIYKVKHLGNRG
eukprot:m.139035 g.139035  ORF g.139035 m.139035 type:complete len:709 (+) comp14789_c0_seq3:109-2235(+)